MNKLFNNFKKFTKTSLGKLLLTIVFLVLTYVFASLSINNGSLLFYLITLVLFVYLLKFAFSLIRDLIHAITK